MEGSRATSRRIARHHLTEGSRLTHLLSTVPASRCPIPHPPSPFCAEQIEEAIAHVEKGMGRKFGATSKEASALLLSVRSGAAISMPGMME